MGRLIPTIIEEDAQATNKLEQISDRVMTETFRTNDTIKTVFLSLAIY